MATKKPQVGQLFGALLPPPEVYAYERARPTTKNRKKLPAQSKLVRVCIVLVSRVLVLLCKYHFCGSVGAYLTL